MFYRIIAYTKFLFTSTNQYGIHSPFIYDFVTKCLYKKSEFKGTKTIRILLKSISHYKAKNLYIDLRNMHIQNLVKSNFAQVDLNHKPYDIGYFEWPYKDILRLILNAESFHNNSMVLIKNIHQNKENNTTWEQLKNIENVTVTIDMFYCGALFFRKEQSKEHFKIRI